MVRPPHAARLGLLLLNVWLLSPVAARAGSSQPDPDSLYRRALSHLASGTAADRHFAMQDLEQAVRRAGSRIDILHAAAWTYSVMGHYGQAHHCLDRITRLEPDDARAQARLGQLWKWQWLASIDPADYSNALNHLLRAAKLDPRDLESRLAITALALVRNNQKVGMAAARSAELCAPGSVEADLALGCAAYRCADITTSDRAFRAAWPRLPASLRRRFTDPRGAAYDAPPEAFNAGAADSASAVCWSGRDPDLTTPENEAQLDFLSRVAIAVLLFRDEQGVRWDMRAELFARYGIPKAVLPPPPPDADQDVSTYLSFAPVRYGPNSAPIRYGPERGPEISVAFPFHMQTWVYPELGMSVPLWDRSLRESYGLAVSYGHETDARPVPELIAARPDLIAIDGGRGVYRALPPGVTPMAARALLTFFPGNGSSRLVAHLEAEGGPSDSLWGSWVAVDTREGRAVARGEGLLAVSACDPVGHRIAQFDAEVPPGEYRVDLAVDDHHGRRGVVHLGGRAVEAPTGLAMSDLVLVCGTAGASVGAVRLEPDLDGETGRRRTISAYFEMDHLTLDAQGRSRFLYRYEVRRIEGEGRSRGNPVAIVEASREEENVGPRRRQFVSAAVPPLDPGAYELEVDVRDLTSGETAARTVRFATR